MEAQVTQPDAALLNKKTPQVALRGEAVSFRRRKMIQKEPSTAI
jgi:hypothetical protein